MHRAAALIEEIGMNEGLPKRMVLDLQLALEEVLTNVIHYAFDGKADRHIDVKCDVQENRIELQVADNGRPFNPLKVPQTDTGKLPEERPVGGLGIYLTCKMMDGIDYQRHDDHNVLTLWKAWRRNSG